VAGAYERRSLAIAPHWPFDQRGRFLPEHTTAVSLLDRLLHHAHVVVTDGDSYRMRGSQNERSNAAENQLNNPRRGDFHLATTGDLYLAIDRHRSKRGWNRRAARSPFALAGPLPMLPTMTPAEALQCLLLAAKGAEGHVDQTAQMRLLYLTDLRAHRHDAEDVWRPMGEGRNTGPSTSPSGSCPGKST